MTFANDYSIWILLIGFAVMGVSSFVRPSMVTAPFDITALSSASRNELRLVYGGFGSVMAGSLLEALFNPALRGGIFLTVSAALSGMAGGREFSWITENN